MHCIILLLKNLLHADARYADLVALTIYNTGISGVSLGGLVTINGTASLIVKDEEINITAISYYAWCNREQGQMKVWLPAQIDKD